MSGVKGAQQHGLRRAPAAALGIANARHARCPWRGHCFQEREGFQPGGVQLSGHGLDRLPLPHCDHAASANPRALQRAGVEQAAQRVQPASPHGAHRNGAVLKELLQDRG